GSASGAGGSSFSAQSPADRRLRDQTAPAGAVYSPRISRGGRVDVLRAELPWHAQTSRLLRGQNPEGCQNCRSARGAADEIRVRHQPEGRQIARLADPSVVAAAGGSSN